MKYWVRKIRDHHRVLPICVFVLQTCRRFGLLRSRRAYSHVPFRGVVTVDCGNGRHFLINSGGHKIENGLFWEGLFSHEPETMRRWLEHASSADVVLDIGANSGVFSLAAATSGSCEVHAFEPLPRVHEILEGNIKLNKHLKIRAWSLAVGAEDGTVTLLDPGGDAPTSASLSREFIEENFSRSDELTVGIVQIDTFCEAQDISRVDLVKIDVEGYEVHVLRGMRETVSRSRPAIIIEALPGREAVLREAIEDLWPGVYQWNWVDEGSELVSRNAMLSPI